MMPIVNYEVFIQRRKRQKQSGATLNVEGNDDKPAQPPPNATDEIISETNENQPATEMAKAEVATEWFSQNRKKK